MASANDVFLSYRAEDTLPGFTSDLLKALHDRGIRAAMDDLTLQNGKELVIIVLSENYVSSSFCLIELSHIYDCTKEKGRSVWPVFYKVEPIDVQSLTGTYGEAMAEASSNFDMYTLQKCKNALHQVAHLPGFHFKNGDESEFIARIVEDVSRKINRAPLYVADYPVGLDSRVEEVCSLLELGSDGVLMVGLYGIPGVGKTALARSVYNAIADQFDGLCVLDRVRENSSKHGLRHLQNILLSETHGQKNIQLGNSNDGVSVLKDRLCHMKVLLILDDVDTLEQLEGLAGGPDWFGPGSRVIITTRDRHLLAFHGVERTYDVRELNETYALEFLTHRVFKQGNADPSYKEVLNEAVNYAFGLPLALEEVGFNFSGRSVDECRKALDRLKRTPHNYIQDVLKTRFAALEENEQDVLLNFACYFNGYELAKVQNMLSARHGYNMNSHIQVLIDKNFISIGSDDKMAVSPLIVDMCNEIVTQESSTEPGRPSRLWFSEEIVQVLIENTSQISHRVPEVSQISKSVAKVLRTSQRVAKDMLQISQRVFQAKKTWRIVGNVSAVVFLFCNAMSTSFNRLIGGWNPVKLFLYVVVSVFILIFISLADQSSFFARHGQLKPYVTYMVLMLVQVYSFFNDKAVDGKPDIWSLVSSATCVLMSLSLSKLKSFGFEIGVFTSFLGIFMTQLLDIHWVWFLVAGIVFCPIYVVHSSWGSRPELSSSDSGLEVGSGGQRDMDIHNT